MKFILILILFGTYQHSYNFGGKLPVIEVVEFDTKDSCLAASELYRKIYSGDGRSTAYCYQK